MRTSARNTICLLLVALAAVGLRTAPGATRTWEEDRNGDGKTDLWVVEDDRGTTEAEDVNHDGRPDVLHVSQKTDQGATLHTTWRDDDGDGRYDFFSVSGPAPEFSEVWRKMDGNRNGYFYIRTDTKAKTRTVGMAPALGSRVLEDVKTISFPEIERSGLSWTNWREGLSVYQKAGNEPGEVIWVEVRSWSATEEVILRDFNQATLKPRSVIIREMDAQTTAPINVKTELVLRTWGESNRYTNLSKYRLASGGVVEQLSATDRNRDGAFDRFFFRWPDGRTALAIDGDYDGLIDRIESVARDGTRTTVRGAEIRERALPVKEAWVEDKINALLERVKRGP